MLSLITVCIAAAVIGTPLQATARTQASDLTELRRLEVIWNEAHLRGDTTALAALWDDDLTVAVPEMPLMTKSDLLAFWRSGHSAITRYETSDLQIRTYENAGVVTGRLQRERNFNGQTVRDDWRFLKVYVRRGGQWRVVAYQASVAPK